MRTILVATDGSEAALRALDFAARMAAAMTDTRLHVLYVRLPVRAYGEIEVYAGKERMSELSRQEAAAILEGPGVSLQTGFPAWSSSNWKATPGRPSSGGPASLAASRS